MCRLALFHIPNRCQSTKKRGRASLTLEQEIKGESDDNLLCFGEVKVVCVDAVRFRPRAIPKSILAVIPDVL